MNFRQLKYGSLFIPHLPYNTLSKNLGHINKMQNNIKNIAWISVVMLLTGCGTADVIKKTDKTYTVSSQYGSMNGSWDRAAKEAQDKATVYCEGRREKIFVVDERRDGIFGISPQRVDITFRCDMDSAQPTTSALKVKEERLREVKKIFDAGLITDAQYNEQVRTILNSQ